MRQGIRGGTVCSGILAPEVAAPEIDWKWTAEIDRFASKVIAAKHPGTNLGDITDPGFLSKLSDVEILVGGTPCQSFSVAGLGRSLDDDRGKLTLRFIEIVHGIKTLQYALWENVPGILSKKDNPFGCFLGGLVGLESPLVCPNGRWTRAGVVDGPKGSVAWRVLNAQYFGLAQRRERVFVVFRAGTGGKHPAEILFEWEGMRRDLAPGREKGKAVTHELAPSLTSSGRGVGRTGESRGQDPVVAMCLNAGGMGRIDAESETFVSMTYSLDGRARGDDGRGYDRPPQIREEQIGCLDSMKIPAVAFNLRGRDGGSLPELTDVASLRASSGGSSRTYVGVRRLTPRECERLQGFPPDYTLLDAKTADGPRYKALGNSMAVPVVRWILGRIMEAVRRHIEPQLESLPIVGGCCIGGCPSYLNGLMGVLMGQSQPA